METNTASMPAGIRPIERPQGPQTTGIQRRGGVTTSPFAPRTDVSLQNSVADVASLLSKIASTKEEATNELSPQLQKLIDNIMKQSFSLESTLAEGLGTTLESQRFAIDQFFTLARMLHQMGSLSEQGTPAVLSDELQTLLSNFKDMMTTGEGKDMEPTMLHKLAFDVLDGKQAETLPAMMQFLLAQQGTAPQLAVQQESDSLGFLKQLMDYFMPRPDKGAEVSRKEPGTAQEPAGQGAADGSEEPGTASEAQNGAETQNTAFARSVPGRNAAQGNAAPQQAPNEAGENASMKPQGEVREGTEPQQPQGAAAQNGAENTENAKQAQQPQQGQQTQQAQQSQQAQQPQQAQQTQQPQQSQQAQQGQQTQQTTQNASLQGQGEAASPRAAEKSTATSYLWENLTAEEQPETSQTAGPNPQDPFAELMRKGLERMQGRLQQAAQYQQNEQEAASASPFEGRASNQPPMQNTPQTMETMKQLASLLLKDAELTPEDERLLTDFVNNKQTMLSENEAKELQMLLRLCEKNVPASVLQSAQEKGMEDMPRLWAFMELCDLAMIKERDPKA